MLRELPTTKIKAAINNKHLFTMKRVATVTGNKIVLLSGSNANGRVLLKFFGNPMEVSDFYEFAALQHG